MNELYPAVFLLTIGIFIGAVWANVSIIGVDSQPGLTNVYNGLNEIPDI